jgi:hypothetical protein
MKDDIIYGFVGSAITAALAFLGKVLGWFAPKDKAEAKKIEAETKVDLASEANKKVDDEIKISKAALEWTVQIAGQLEKANQVIEKRQAEVERLTDTIANMKSEFEAIVLGFNKRIQELEEALKATTDELQQEREINQKEMEAILKKNGAK